MAKYVDCTELKKFADRLNTLNKSAKQEICVEAANELANRLMRSAIKLTPTDTGHLRGSWRVSEAKPDGGGATATVYNPVKYAPYVEYGHRQKPGRYVPAIGKRLKKSWVNGKHMLKRAEDETSGIAPKVINRIVKEKLDGIL